MEHFFTSDERQMLVRYCSRFTHDWSLAEDLAQQALLEAWLKSDQLYSQQVRPFWLTGIARNVCLRWVRNKKQEQARFTRMSDLPAEVESGFEDEVDLEQEYEQHELEQLLEKAVALLPPQTRNVLVQHYLEAIPQAEVAARLGITVGAVEARLRRGKLALRHLLTHELRQDANSYGLITPEVTDWQQTHIWCPVCGQRQLLIRLPDSPGTIAFRCPNCNSEPQEFGWGYPLSNPHFVQHLANLRRPKAILRRFTSWAYEYYSAAASHGVVACAQCGQQRRLHLTLPTHLSEASRHYADRYGLSGKCPSCGWQDYCSPAGFLYSLPGVQRFWQAHPRIRLVYHEPVSEVAGQHAWVASFESLTSTASIDIVLAQETLNLIKVHAHSL